MTDPYRVPSFPRRPRRRRATSDSPPSGSGAPPRPAPSSPTRPRSRRSTFEGPDAATFLQGQLSNDVDALAPGQGQWTTYNSPKGRMLATLFLFRSPDGRRLHGAPRPRSRRSGPQASRDVRAAREGHASRRRRRRRVPRRRRAGRAGRDRATRSAMRRRPAVPPDTGRHVVVHLPDGRFVVTAPRADAAAVFDALAQRATPAGAPVWAWLGVRAGVPMITAATQDQFVAQTANWDALARHRLPQGLLHRPGDRGAHAAPRPPEGAPVRVPRPTSSRRRPARGCTRACSASRPAAPS